MPLKELKGFQRVSISTGKRGEATIKIPVKDLQKWDLTNHRWKLYPGQYQLIIGNNSQTENLASSFSIGK